jgi:hypothetical protein
MYYPFLRARQFELLALRELASENATQETIIPIIEPIRESHNNLNLAHNVFQDKNQIAYLVLNPTIGELAGDSSYYLNYLSGLKDSKFFSAFHYKNNYDFIKRSIENFNLTDCMLICASDIDSDDKDFKLLATEDKISSIIVSDPNRNRSLNRFIKELNKNYIRLDDLFEKQARNSDYLEIQGHKFSEEHIYYDEEGFKGFSDYTVLPSEYIDGGITPRAVVIHLTYLYERQIWIRHFTSETNDSISNVQGKFAEAAEKALVYCRKNKLNNSAIAELMSYYDNEHYPGLGVIKKISIKNHLLVVNQFLRSK